MRTPKNIILPNENKINDENLREIIRQQNEAIRYLLSLLYGDLSDFVSNYPNGFIIVKNEVENINKSIDDIINNHYDLDEMGKNNRFIAENYISWNNKSKELLEFYKKLI